MADTDSRAGHLAQEVEKLRREIARLQAVTAQNGQMEANIVGLTPPLMPQSNYGYAAGSGPCMKFSCG